MLLKLIFVFGCTIIFVYNVEGKLYEEDQDDDFDGNTIDNENDEEVENQISEANDSINDKLKVDHKLLDDAERKIQKWKAWKKYLDCSRSSTGLVQCRLINKLAKGNPDFWKKEAPKEEILARPPKGFNTRNMPKEIDGSLFDWLTKLYALVKNQSSEKLDQEEDLEDN